MVAAVLAAVWLLLAAPAAAQQLSELYRTPGVPPPGANDFGCRPTPDRPYPVVLVHGTFGDMTMSWQSISPALADDGYCVFALDLVERGSAPVVESAQKLAAFVDEVLAATGAERVSFVGHSQGGMIPRYYVKHLGGLARTEDAVGLAPSHHGTTTPLAPPAAALFDCPACADQVAGSEFMHELNSGEDAPAEVDWTVIATRYDQIVTPVESQFLAEGANVANVLIQEECRFDPVDHVGLLYDPQALAWIRSALGREGPADAGLGPGCLGEAR